MVGSWCHCFMIPGIISVEDRSAFGKIIAKAWRDPAFKAALIANSAIAV